MEVSTVSLWQQQEENPEGFEVASRKTKVSESRLFLPAAALHNYRDGVSFSQAIEANRMYNLDSLHALVYCYGILGRLSEMKSPFQKALAKWDGTLGLQNLLVVNCRKEYIVLLRDLEEYNEAKEQIKLLPQTEESESFTL